MVERNVVSRPTKSVHSGKCRTWQYDFALYACAWLTFGMLVAERASSHVTEACGSCAAAEGQQVAVVRVKLCHCDHLTEVLHVFRL